MSTAEIEKQPNELDTNQIEDEPKIEEEEQPKKEKKTTMLFKIDPVLPYFPTNENVNKEQMVQIRQYFNNFDFSSA